MLTLVLALLLVSTAAFSQAVKTHVLEDEFRLDPELQKGVLDYEEKKLKDMKLFKKNNLSEYKVTSALEFKDQISVYQLKLEKSGSRVFKTERYAELLRHPLGQVKFLLKCHKNEVKGDCQTYTGPFCRELLKEKDWFSRLNTDGLRKTLDFYKNIYVEKGAMEVKY